MANNAEAQFEPIETERLRLRSLRFEDAPTVKRLAGDRDIAKTTLNIPHPYEDGMAEEWIARTHDAVARGDQISLAITLRADEQDGLIGAVGLVLNKQNHSGELGYWIGKPYWNNGYGTEAAGALVAYGFRHRGLNRIQARHMTSNPASGRIMQKIGMSYEGTHRDAALRFGTYDDLAMYAILRSEWQNQAPGR